MTLTHAYITDDLVPVSANPFSNENGAVLLRFQNICVHTYRFRIVFAHPHHNAGSVLKTLLYLQYACSIKLDASAFQYIGSEIGAKLKPRGSVRPPFWILTVEWSGARSCLFDDVTVFR